MLTLKPELKLVLASASPRRRQLLKQIGLEPLVQPVQIDESTVCGEDPVAQVKNIALAKFKEAQKSKNLSDTVLVAADTIVCLGDRIYGKPRTAADAFSMLKTLSGQRHRVISAICIGHAYQTLVRSEVTYVEFSPLSDEMIQQYVQTGEPMDKAGAYAIQGAAACFVKKLEGCYFNVVGLPLNLFSQMLQAIDVLQIPLTRSS